MRFGARYLPMVIWAARDIQRQGGSSLLLFFSLSVLVFMVATVLLFTQAMDATRQALMNHAPDLVVRRIDAGGWAPLPADQAVACAEAVAGALDPTPRIWGVAMGSGGPVTLVSSLRWLSRPIGDGIHPPSPGQAVVGQGIFGDAPDGRLVLYTPEPVSFTITGRFPENSGLVTHDLVWLSPEDARAVLGLKPGQASDLAVHLFRREEEKAIQADLAAAFPWPVRITDLSTHLVRQHTHIIQIGGITLVAWIPAMLAMLYIIAGTFAFQNAQRHQWGLMKALGWTTENILSFQMAKALVIGGPALALGIFGAYVMVFHPPSAALLAHWVTGGQQLPALFLSAKGVPTMLIQVVAMVGLPYLATVFLSSLRLATGDPGPHTQVNPWN